MRPPGLRPIIVWFMKIIKLISFIIIAIDFSCSSIQSQNLGARLPANEFAEKIKQLPSAPVIDVRTAEEFSKGHLLNARNIDWNANDFMNRLSGLDKSKPVFVYCLSGGRSGAAASHMRSEGFIEVYELQGGIMKWREARLPETEEARNQPPQMSRSRFDSLTNSDKMVLVDFYAEWCVPCKKMKPYIDEISTTMTQEVSVIRINADDSPQLCKELGIAELPFLQLYRNNVLAWTKSGYASKEELFSKLR